MLTKDREVVFVKFSRTELYHPYYCVMPETDEHLMSELIEPQ